MWSCREKRYVVDCLICAIQMFVRVQLASLDFFCLTRTSKRARRHESVVNLKEAKRVLLYICLMIFLMTRESRKGGHARTRGGSFQALIEREKVEDNSRVILYLSYATL
jgi:hypothetical protein